MIRDMVGFAAPQAKGTKIIVDKFSSPLVNPVHVVSYENVGRFFKSPSGRFTKSSYRFSSLLVCQRHMGNSCENKFASGRVASERLLAHSLLAYSLFSFLLVSTRSWGTPEKM